jgi:hypothetical protein
VATAITSRSGKGFQDVVPRLVAEKRLWLVAGEILEGCGGLPGRFLTACGHGDEIKLHPGEFTRVFVQSDARELSGDAEALQVRVSTRVNISAEHAGADKGDFDGGFHGCGMEGGHDLRASRHADTRVPFPVCLRTRKNAGAFRLPRLDGSR